MTKKKTKRGNDTKNFVRPPPRPPCLADHRCRWDACIIACSDVQFSHVANEGLVEDLLIGTINHRLKRTTRKCVGEQMPLLEFPTVGVSFLSPDLRISATHSSVSRRSVSTTPGCVWSWVTAMCRLEEQMQLSKDDERLKRCTLVDSAGRSDAILSNVIHRGDSRR